jgi:hypothetical protein
MKTKRPGRFGNGVARGEVTYYKRVIRCEQEDGSFLG